MEFTYLAQPPKRYTFEQPKLKAWVEAHCRGIVLNLFAGKIRLGTLNSGPYREIRNDIDPKMPADYHMDAFEFVCACKAGAVWRTGGSIKSFTTVILDPPYNIRKAREKYDGRWIGKLTKIKNLLPDIIPIGGRVISLGYDSVGMSKSRGFRKIALCLVCHGGDHNDTICLVEERESDVRCTRT